MRPIRTYLLHIAAALMICSGLASCRQDDFLADVEGTLPPGSHPISFVATVGGMRTRSEGKNAWKDGDEIGIRTINLKGRKYSMIGRYSVNEEGMMMDVVKRYSVTGDGVWNELDTLPLEWPYPKGIVSAWYPFEPRVDIAIDNQAEKGFDHLDFLSAMTGETSYTDVVDLEFKHRMAKVSCMVVPGDGITEDEFRTLWLRLHGHTRCSFRETELTGSGGIGWIIPDSTCSHTDGRLYEALLVPDAMKDMDLINIGLKVTYNKSEFDKLFAYPSPEIEAGRHYIYNVVVHKDRIDVTVFSGEWIDEGAGQHAPNPYTFRVNLTDDLISEINVRDPRTGTYVIDSDRFGLSGNVTPLTNKDTGLIDRFDVLGNEFTVNVTAGTDRRSYNLVVQDREAVNNTQVVNDRSNGGKLRTYKRNDVFLIADETTLGYRSELKVGDYFFDDGSWSSDHGWEDVKCIGIVFAVNGSDDPSVFRTTDSNGAAYEADKAADYKNNPDDPDHTDNPIRISNRIHGYVLALRDAVRVDTKVKQVEKEVNGEKVTVDSVYYETVVKFSWSPADSSFKFYGPMCSESKDDFNGYANMLSVKENQGKTLAHNYIEVPQYEKLEAFAAAEGYAVAAPANTSGWYLPSIRQLETALSFIHTFESHLPDSPIVKAGGVSPAGGYWSSTVTTDYPSAYYTGNMAWYYSYEADASSAANIVKQQTKLVRAILTF